MALDIANVELVSNEAGVEPDSGPQVSDTNAEAGSQAAEQSSDESTPAEALPSDASAAAAESGEQSPQERYEEWLEAGGDPLEFLQDPVLPEAFPRRAKQMRDMQRAFTKARQDGTELDKALAEIRRFQEEYHTDKTQYERETAGDSVGESTDGEAFDRKKYEELLLDDPTGVTAQLYQLRCDSHAKDQMLQEMRSYIDKQKEREQESARTAKEHEQRLAERVALRQEFQDFGLTEDQSDLAAALDIGDRAAGFKPDREAIAAIVRRYLPKTRAELQEALKGTPRPVAKKKVAPSEAVGAEMLKRAIKSAEKPARPAAGAPVGDATNKQAWMMDPRKAARSIADTIDLVPD